MLITKITEGYVKQVFDTEKKQFIQQEFQAEDIVSYEDENGHLIEPISMMLDAYLSFDMLQPK